MTQARRETLLIGVLVTTLGLAALWALSQYRTARATSAQAEVNLASCRDAATRIQALRQRPTLAADTEVEHLEIGGLTDAAIAQAGLNISVENISRPRRSRVPDTAYTRASIDLLLKDVTLRQSITFLQAMRDLDSALGVQRLQFVAPREKNQDRWRVEATISYMIYAPPEENIHL